MKGRSLLTLLNLSPEEIRFLLDEALDFKRNRDKFIQSQPLITKMGGLC